MTRTIYIPAPLPESEIHLLPYADNKRDGSLALCSHCDRWFIKYTDYTTWVDPAWRPVRFYDISAKRRIKKALSAEEQ